MSAAPLGSSTRYTYLMWLPMVMILKCTHPLNRFPKALESGFEDEFLDADENLRLLESDGDM